VTAILAIDQSTSATKALLFDDQGQLLDQVSKEHRQYYPKPGWVEHDAEEIYQNLLSTTRTLLDRNPGFRDQLQCVSITNQRETVLVFEKDSGRPLHHAIVWQCRRGAGICESLSEEGYNPLVRSRTGLMIDTYFSASKLRWLVENQPEIARSLHNGSALIGTIDTYLIYRLTGQQVHATDPTNASRTLLFDIGRLQWDEELCALFRVPAGALPQVRESCAQFGETNLDGLLPRPLPIIGVMGDSQAALFAQCCYTAGSSKITLGTGTSILLNTGSQLRILDGGIVSTIAWVIHGQPTYALEGIINFSAATIAWLKNQLGLIESAHETEALALSVADNGGVYLVPAFVGLSAPYWAANARAAILGLTPDSTRAHVVRAGLESIAYQVKDALDLMIREVKLPLSYIHADGGAVQNRFLMQFIADLIQIPVRVSELPELSALGAVYAGLLGLGKVDSLEGLAALPRGYTPYHPAEPQARMEVFYSGWKEAVRRVL
jgi:glycerol kinase